METALIILSVVFSILSGICKAVMDLSEESKIKGNPLFWHKNKSWQNKWKNGDKKQGEKFWGSSRWFVAQTDAWHLFGVLFRISFAVAYTCIGMLTTVSYFYLFGVVVAYILFATSFHIFYTFKILRK
mgnify:CR=1 FL=1